MPCVERSGLRFDRKRDPGWCDRHAVDIATPLIRQRVTHSPPLRPQRGQHPSNLVLRTRADTAAASEAQPMTSADQRTNRDEQQHTCRRDCAGARCYDRGSARPHADSAARCCSAQPPVLLAAGKTPSEHGQKLALPSDEGSLGPDKRHDDHVCEIRPFAPRPRSGRESDLSRVPSTFWGAGHTDETTPWSPSALTERGFPQEIRYLEGKCSGCEHRQHPRLPSIRRRFGPIQATET